MSEISSKRPVGRPRSVAAGSHEKILTAVYELLQETSVRDLTIEAIAARAGVGKPTIYKWWDSKAALVLAMFQERVVPAFAVPETATLEESIRAKVDILIRLFNGFFGKVMAELIAESQSEAALLRDLNEQYIRPRRASVADDIRRAQAENRFPRETDAELVVDAIFGGIYYNLLLKLRPLTPEYGQALVDMVLGLPRVRPSASR